MVPRASCAQASGVHMSCLGSFEHSRNEQNLRRSPAFGCYEADTKEFAVLDRRRVIRQISEDRTANNGWIEAFQEDFNPKQC
jgi:hypothetical protein